MNHKETLLELINAQAPTLIGMLGGCLFDINEQNCSCIFEFDISKEFCHSIDVVQGGFITAMLDVAMCHSVIANGTKIAGVSSLEIKTSYLEVTRAGKLRVEGYTIKQTHKTAFMEGKIYNQDNILTATSSSVGKIIRLPNE